MLFSFKSGCQELLALLLHCEFGSNCLGTDVRSHCNDLFAVVMIVAECSQHSEGPDAALEL